jgi:hypothetical protein
MEADGSARHGAAAGAVVVALFVAAAVIDPARPGFDAGGAEVAGFYAAGRTRIAVECALLALAAPLFVWFLATVVSLAGSGAAVARRAARVAFGCGVTWLALFMVDVTTLAVGALRPRTPDVASALQDLEWLAMGMASLLAAGLLIACAVLALRAGAVWPRWVGWLAAIAAPLYALRLGTLFTTDGPFAADGVLGLYVPVVAFAGWLAVASLVLARSDE